MAEEAGMNISKISTTSVFQPYLQKSGTDQTQVASEGGTATISPADEDAYTKFGNSFKQVFGLNIKLKSSQRDLVSAKKELESMKKQDTEFALYGQVSDETPAIRTKKEDTLNKQVDTYTQDIKDSQDSLAGVAKTINPSAADEIEKLADKTVAKMFGDKVKDDGTTIDSIIDKYYQQKQNSMASTSNSLPAAKSSIVPTTTHTIDYSV
jgi:archaellum component FlaC